MHALLAALLLPACSTYAVLPGEDASGGTGDDTAAPSDTAEAACDGLDEDGDGRVDDGFGDHDADGVADCVDDACAVTLEAAGTSEVAACAAGVPEVAEPWRATVKWEWDGEDERLPDAFTAPLVAQFDDDDGDGDVDADDVPDVAVVVSHPDGAGAVALLDGHTGALKWVVRHLGFNGNSALGDLDGDGRPEVLTFSQQNEPIALTPDGDVLWTAETATPTYIGGMPSLEVVDLDGDGAAEVVANHLILDGRTGQTLQELPIGERAWHVPGNGDLDGDGLVEIMWDGSVYEPDGTLLWTAIPTSFDNFYAPVPLILDADGDPDGEVVFVDADGLHLYDADGTLLLDAPGTGEDANPPCAGDFDGDGAVEIAVPFSSALWLYELDGTVAWTTPISDTTSAAGCSGFDADGDGSVEIVYADERDFFLFDGATGTPLLTLYDHGSGTLFEYPTIADLDGDGHAEILVSNNGDTTSWPSVVALAHDGAGWMSAPQTWAAYNRVPGRFGPAGEVLDPGQWWRTENTYRTLPSAHQPSTEMRLVAGDACASACEAPGTVQVAVQVANTGEAGIDAGIELNFYRLDGVVQTWLATATLPDAVPPHTSSASVTFTTGVENVGLDGLVVRVNEDRLAVECDETDNAAYFEDVGCE